MGVALWRIVGTINILVNEISLAALMRLATSELEVKATSLLPCQMHFLILFRWLNLAVLENFALNDDLQVAETRFLH